MSSWKYYQQQPQAGYGKQEISDCSGQRGLRRGLQITRRQQDVLIRIMAGMCSKEIARDLDLSVSTVKNHLASLYGRLGVNNRTGAAAVGTRIKGTEQPHGFGEQPTQRSKNYAVKYQYDQEGG